MIQGKRLSVVIPSGRQRVMSILIANLRRFPEIDEVQAWVNVEDDGSQADDLAWIEALPSQWGKVVLAYRPEGAATRKPKQRYTGLFYGHAQEADTVYVRLDDDIVYVDDGFFEAIVACRLKYPDPPLVMANIWNNAVCSYLQQQEGHVGTDHGTVEAAFCMDPVGWASGEFAEYLHRVLLAHIANNMVDRLYLAGNYALENTRFSVSAICWTGEAMREMAPPPDDMDEEIWLTETYPLRVGRDNLICGDALVSHYSFFPQRPHLDQTDILDRYRKVAEKALSSRYYDLLGQASA